MPPLDKLPGPRYGALLQLLRTAEALWNSSRLFFARWDLSPSQFNVLNLLCDHPDGCTQIELSRQLIMHRSNLPGLIDRLEQLGHIRSVHDQLAAELDLGATVGMIAEQIEDVELAWTQIPAGEEQAARIPQGFGGAQQLQQGAITRAG